MNRNHTAIRVAFVWGLLVAALSSASAAWAQGRISGHVTDVFGRPLAGANVEVTGQRLGASTGEDGAYVIDQVPPGSFQVTASIIGYMASVRRNVSVGRGLVELDFVLAEEPIELSNTVISASAIGEEVTRAPNRVDIVDRAEIVQSAARNLQEVFQNVEGLYVPTGEGLLTTFPRLVMRGMTTGYLGRTTAALVLLNGHPISGTLGSWGSSADLDALPLNLVQKTEVIKGPYTSTFGSGATGGVINILTRKNFPAPLGGDVQVKAGPYGFRAVTPVVFGQRHQVSYAAWGEFLHGDERYTRRLSTWDSARNGYLAKGWAEQTKYGFMLGYDVGPGERLDLLANHLEKYNNYGGRPISREEMEADIAQIAFRHRIDEHRELQVLGNYLDTQYDGFADATPVHPDSSDRLVSTSGWPNRELGLKVLLSGRFQEMHSFSTGVEWRRSHSGRDRYYGRRGEVLEFDVGGTQDIYSVFLEDRVRLGNLEVTPGVRLEQWQDRALYSRQEDLPDDAYRQVHIGYASGEADNKAVNPKLGLSYLVSDRLKLRFSAGSTFRAPRITETYSPNYQTLSWLHYQVNPDLQEETVISYEAGVDFHTADQRLSASLTGFYVDARDRIEFTVTGGFTDADPAVIVHRNMDSTIPGIEGEVGYWITEALSAGANFSYVNPKYGKTGIGFDDNTTPGVPDHTVNLHLDYRPLAELSMRLAWQRIGTIYDDSENKVELDPYSLANLKVRYDLPLGSGAWYLDAALTNLLDEDYQVPSSNVWDYEPLGRGLHVALGYGF